MRGARARVACLGLLVLVFGGTRVAPAQDDFYRGKTIRIVVGYSAGGGFDTYSRAIARHLLRTAFIKTLGDAEFVTDARRAQLDMDPISGEDVARLIDELFRMPPAVLAKLKELLR